MAVGRVRAGNVSRHRHVSDALGVFRPVFVDEAAGEMVPSLLHGRVPVFHFCPLVLHPASLLPAKVALRSSAIQLHNRGTAAIGFLQFAPDLDTITLLQLKIIHQRRPTARSGARARTENLLLIDGGLRPRHRVRSFCKADGNLESVHGRQVREGTNISDMSWNG